MNISCKNLKRISRENLTFHYSVPMMAYVTSSVLATLLRTPFLRLQDEYATSVQTVTLYLAEFIIAVLATVLTFGEFKIHLNMARKKEYTLSQLFYGFRNQTERYLLFSLLLTVLTLLCLLPFYAGFLLFSAKITVARVFLLILSFLVSLILTVLVQIQFQLLYFVALDYEEMGLSDVLKTSFKMIKNHRGHLFYIYLSFIGMMVLALLSFGIGLLWVEPYQMQTLTNFYLCVKGEKFDVSC